MDTPHHPFAAGREGSGGVGGGRGVQGGDLPLTGWVGVEGGRGYMQSMVRVSAKKNQIRRETTVVKREQILEELYSFSYNNIKLISDRRHQLRRTSPGASCTRQAKSVGMGHGRSGRLSRGRRCDRVRSWGG